MNHQSLNFSHALGTRRSSTCLQSQLFGQPVRKINSCFRLPSISDLDHILTRRRKMIVNPTHHCLPRFRIYGIATLLVSSWNRLRNTFCVLNDVFTTLPKKKQSHIKIFLTLSTLQMNWLYLVR